MWILGIHMAPRSKSSPRASSKPAKKADPNHESHAYDWRTRANLKQNAPKAKKTGDY